MGTEGKGRIRALAELELEVEAEGGREWTRRRLEQRSQEEAGRLGGSPFGPTSGGGAGRAGLS